MITSGFAWTDERIEELKRRWDQGESCSQIAAAMGNPSRSSIIGKIHRLGLGRPAVPRVRAARPSNRLGQYAKDKALSELRIEPPPGPVDEPPAEPSTNGSALHPALDPALVPLSQRIGTVTDLRANTCRWPYGDPRDRDNFFFCGAVFDPRAPGGQLRSYCAQHESKAHEAPRVRRSVEAA